MNRRSPSLRAAPWAVLGLAGLLLAGCGGGHGGDPVADRIPPSATASPEAFTQYLASLPADDGAEPLAVDGLEPPTSETAEPLPVSR